MEASIRVKPTCNGEVATLDPYCDLSGRDSFYSPVMPTTNKSILTLKCALCTGGVWRLSKCMLQFRPWGSFFWCGFSWTSADLNVPSGSAISGLLPIMKTSGKLNLTVKLTHLKKNTAP